MYRKAVSTILGKHFTCLSEVFAVNGIYG